MKIFLALASLFVSSFLYAQPTFSIIAGTFLSQDEADKSLVDFKQRLNAQEMVAQYRQQYGFEVLTKRSGNYYIIAVGVFESQNAADEMLPVVRKIQRDSFVVNTDKRHIKAVVDADAQIKEKTSETVEDNTKKKQEEEIRQIVEEITLAKDEKQNETPEKQKDTLVKPEKSISAQQTMPVAKEDTRSIKEIKKEAIVAKPEISPVKKEPVSTKEVKAKEVKQMDEKYLWELYTGIVAVLCLIFLVFMYKYFKLKNSYKKETKIKADLISKMSREMKIPMQIIIGFSDILSQAKLDNLQFTHLTNIKNSSDLLLGMINNVLDFSRMDAKKLEIVNMEFNINNMLDHVSDVTSMQAMQKELELIFEVSNDIPSKLVGDQIRLTQILIGLITNAIDYTHQGEVSLKIKKANRSDNKKVMMEFKVSDTGIGIKEKDLATLFETVVDESEKEELKQKKGLGLIVSKKLARMMGGDIKVESEFGYGSTFTFTAQLEIPENLDRRQYRLPSKDIMHKKVLSIIGNQNVADSLANMLSYYHMSSVNVFSFGEAIRALEKVPYDIICIDSKIIGDVKQNSFLNLKKKRDIKIMVFESDLDHSDKNISKKFKIDAQINKPFNQQNFLDAIFEAYDKKVEKKDKEKKEYTKEDIAQLKGSKIILAEDNQINQALILGFLSNTGIETFVASNGKEVVKALKEDPDIDLVVMDINMPEMDGYEATKIIRSDEIYDRIPIVAVSGDDPSVGLKRAKDAKMQDFIGKPMRAKIFYELLLKHIKLKTEVDTQDKKEKKQQDKNVAPDIEDLDTNIGLDMTAGDIVFYKDILSDFVSMYRNSPELFEKYIKEQNWDEGKKLSHDIKGVSGNIGALKLYEAVKILDNSFAEKGNKDFDMPFENFKNNMNTVAKSIDLFLESR